MHKGQRCTFPPPFTCKVQSLQSRAGWVMWRRRTERGIKRKCSTSWTWMLFNVTHADCYEAAFFLNIGWSAGCCPPVSSLLQLLKYTFVWTTSELWWKKVKPGWRYLSGILSTSPTHTHHVKENIEHNSEKFHFNDCLYVTHTAVFHITHKIKWLTAKMNLKSNIKSILFRVCIHV